MILSFAAIVSACQPVSTATKPAKKPVADSSALASGPRPDWVDKSAFASAGDDALHVYAVAACPIEEKDVCWKPSLLLQACRNRALGELAKAIGSTQQTVIDNAMATTATATIEHAAVNVGWFDGDHTIYAVAEQLQPKEEAPTKKLSIQSFSGGTPLNKVEERVREGARAYLKAKGVCDDSHKRSSYACCGDASHFCSDPSRFDAKISADRCKCGEGPPCLFDFKCKERQGAKKCICEGSKCPCDILSCKKGQTCGDGRCY